MSTEFQTLHEIVQAARANLPDGPWDYLMGGAESETTQLRNRLALDSIAFRPRVLRDVSNIDCTSTLLGEKTRLPVFVAPLGSPTIFEQGGALSVAKGAERFGVMSMLSSVATPGIEELAAQTKHAKTFQPYVRGDRAWVADYVRRAIEHGNRAFCFTVDTAIYSRRERDLIKRWLPSARNYVYGFEYQASVSWDLIKWYKDEFKFPLILKGIATAEDAQLAVEHGVEVVYVSNHGGRQLDHGRGTIEVLPEVVKAVGGKAEVWVDGGFLRGTDVLKAIALGAGAVGIGRLHGFGLAAAGEAGVARVLELLEDEVRRDMGLLGVTRLDQLNASYLHAAAPVYPAHHVASAFPFLNLPAATY
jgi:isopentenyl diphosphate isomerase/L-lactate dehydrogenase-like FMN-dependent dehydrogenase